MFRADISHADIFRTDVFRADILRADLFRANVSTRIFKMIVKKYPQLTIQKGTSCRYRAATVDAKSR
jgi:uncharacterized protein YjbI with pentapeptide repeats